MKTLIVLPDELGAELKHSVPARQRSHFIAQAIEKQLRAMKFRKTLQQTAGIWGGKEHSQFKTQAGINRYIGRLRGWK